MTRPKRNVVKFPKPCRPRKPGPPFGLTLEQLMQGRDVLKRVLAEYEADIAAREHTSVVYLRRADPANDPPLAG